MTTSIFETIIDKMDNYTLSDRQRAELASFHDSQVQAQDKSFDSLIPWTKRAVPGIRTFGHGGSTNAF